MAGFIEEFYYGNIDPQARGAKPNETVKKELQKLTDYEEDLTNLLTGEEKKKFLSYVNAWGVVNGEGTLDSLLSVSGSEPHLCRTRFCQAERLTQIF